MRNSDCGIAQIGQCGPEANAECGVRKGSTEKFGSKPPSPRECRMQNGERARTMPDCSATPPVKQRLTPGPARTFLHLGAPLPLAAPQFTEAIERLIRE